MSARNGHSIACVDCVADSALFGVTEGIHILDFASRRHSFPHFSEGRLGWGSSTPLPPTVSGEGGDGGSSYPHIACPHPDPPPSSTGEGAEQSPAEPCFRQTGDFRSKCEHATRERLLREFLELASLPCRGWRHDLQCDPGHMEPVMWVIDRPECACDGVQAVGLCSGCTPSRRGRSDERISVPSDHNHMEEDQSC